MLGRDRDMGRAGRRVAQAYHGTGGGEVEENAILLPAAAAVLVMALGASCRSSPGYPGFSLNARGFPKG
jgi:hypothetical protein